jgi:hypothetical protein
MGRTIDKSGDTIKRILPDNQSISKLLSGLACQFFKGKKELILVIDDTLIHKIHSRFMQGSGYFYDTKLGKKILGYKLLVCGVTDGNYFIPLTCAFIYSNDVCPNPIPTKSELIKQMIESTIHFFSRYGITITVAADGAFSTKLLLSWFKENSIRAQLRMHSNRKVFYQGEYISIRDIKALKPRGRQMARTIKVTWHDIPLYITAERRIDKHGVESIVYLAATYRAKPKKHVQTYKKRWPIEMFFRTAKQHLGLKDCFSRDMTIQKNHIAGVFLAYAFLQITRKKRKLKTPEEALRLLKTQKVSVAANRISSLIENFGAVHE